MATAREIRYRVLYLAVGATLVLATLWAAVALPAWWWVGPAALALGWWSTLVRLGVEHLLGSLTTPSGGRPD
jgi:hypothetical protein